jgi:predicted dehydrogenase
LKVLFVGLGGIGQRHVRNLRHLYGDSIGIIAARSRGLSHVISEKLDITDGDVESKYGIEAFDDIARALDERPDAALICNPTSMHIEAATAAVEAGCHVLIEKPLSDSMNGVEELASIVERRGVAGMVGYQLRFHPCLIHLRSVLEKGVLGRLLAVRAAVGEYLPGWHRYEDYRDMYASKRALGGGVILSQIHELDYLAWLFGAPRRVFAIGGHLSSLEIDVEDTASILMECEHDGRTLPVHLHQDYLQRPPSRTCEVIGEDGKAVLDFNRLTVEVTGPDGPLPDSFSAAGFERNNLFLDEMTHFIACVRGEETPAVSIREGAMSLKMALAARESLDTGRSVTLS